MCVKWFDTTVVWCALPSRAGHAKGEKELVVEAEQVKPLLVGGRAGAVVLSILGQDIPSNDGAAALADATAADNNIGIACIDAINLESTVASAAAALGELEFGIGQFDVGIVHGEYLLLVDSSICVLG
jgi:hypothetical protein